YFGLSDEANILSFDIEGQISNTIVRGERDAVGEVNITVPSLYNRETLKVTGAVCTQLARFTADPFALTDFSQPVELTLIAEDTTVRKKWRITVTPFTAPTQLPFSNMKKWTVAKDNDGKEITYKEDGVTKSAYFPGDGVELSPWQSSAEANAYVLSGINTMTTGPRPTASAAGYARIETVFIQSTAAKFAKAQVVTGALFTGKFLFSTSYAPVIGTTEPRKMINVGVSYSGYPQAARVKLRYRPGDVMTDGTGTPITVDNANGRPLRDSCEIYVLLHRRYTDDDAFVRVAAAHWRTGESAGNMEDDAAGFEEITIPFVYGEPEATVLAEKPYAKIGGQRGELTFYRFPVSKESRPVREIYAADPSATPVDHIIVLFSSSVYGDFFWGAVNTTGPLRGSTLDIKDFELMY
ncbi:MAG: PCMD domain-containing protein, partial [Bacteroidales bacterium]|nr:PCMD domain-containing protein [Bacteroidales bacterium]